MRCLPALILHGQAARAAAEMTAQADREHLAKGKREGMDTCVRYLASHLDQLRYDTALKGGWPIATGRSKACRHLIGGRLDITGARWDLEGAEAILRLRALTPSNDLDAYWTFHTAREHQRLYPIPNQADYIPTA